MKRRTLIKSALTLPFGVPGLFQPNIHAATNDKLLLFINMSGGWDVSSFCDPKLNILGEPIINTWAKTKDILREGNIDFADFGNNTSFFAKYAQDILIINGVDAQSNSHGAGARFNFTGKIGAGYPSVTSLYAAIKGGGIALPHLKMGTGRPYMAPEMKEPIRISSVDMFRQAIRANKNGNGNAQSFSDNDYRSVLKLKKSAIERIVSTRSSTPGNERLRESYARSLAGLDSLEQFYAATLPYPLATSGFKQQIETTLIAFASGLTLTADIGAQQTGSGGSFDFDTHSNHDASQESILIDSLNGIDYLWSLAEQIGLANNLIVVVGSDFARTPYYNADLGKDHWAVGSFMVMERNAPYTNKVVGATDALQNAKKISTSTLMEDEKDGVYLTPAHVHKALRKYLGIIDKPESEKFPFLLIEDIAFFG